MSSRATTRAAARLAGALERGVDPADVLDALAVSWRTPAMSLAARDAAAGVALADALDRHGVLPRTYVEAFAAGDPRAAGTLAAAVAAADRRCARFKAVAVAAASMLAGVILALAVGARFALPALSGWLREHGADPGPLWWRSAAALEAVATPAGLLVVAAVLLIFVLSAGRLWRATRSGWCAHRAVACRSIEALLGAGLPPERVLPLAGAVCGHPTLSRHLRRAGVHVEGGRPMADVLSSARLTPAALDPLWRTAAGPGDVLRRTAGAMADVLESEAVAREPVTGQWLWWLYGLIGGALVGAFGATVMVAWAEVLAWAP